MNILLYALIGGAIAGGGALLVSVVGTWLRLPSKVQQFGFLLVFALAMGAVRVLPIDDIASRLRSQSSIEAEIDRELLQHSSFKALHDFHPEVYNSIKDEAVFGLKSGHSKDLIVKAIRPKFVNYLYDRLSYSSDILLLDLMSVSLRQANYLRDVDPNYCFEIFFTPEILSFDVETVLPKALIGYEEEVTAKILSSVSNTLNNNYYSEDEVVDFMAEIVLKLTIEESAILSEIDFDFARAVTSAQKEASCGFMVTMFTEINRLPPSNAARMYRGLMVMA